VAGLGYNETSNNLQCILRRWDITQAQNIGFLPKKNIKLVLNDIKNMILKDEIDSKEQLSEKQTNIINKLDEKKFNRDKKVKDLVVEYQKDAKRRKGLNPLDINEIKIMYNYLKIKKENLNSEQREIYNLIKTLYCKKDLKLNTQ